MGIGFVKIHDEAFADEYNLGTLPALVYYRRQIPILFEGSLYDCLKLSQNTVVYHEMFLYCFRFFFPSNNQLLGELTKEEDVLEWLVQNKSTGDEEDLIEEVTSKTLNTLIGNIDELVVLFCK